MLEDGFAKVESDLHHVAKWDELSVGCLITRFEAGSGSIQVYERSVVSASATCTTAQIRDQICGGILCEFGGRRTDGDFQGKVL